MFDDQIEAACNSLEEMFQTLGQTDNYENETEDEDDITEIEDIHSVTKTFSLIHTTKIKNFSHMSKFQHIKLIISTKVERYT